MVQLNDILLLYFSLFQIMFSVAQQKNLYYLDILNNLLSSVFYSLLSEKNSGNTIESVDPEKYNQLSECTKKVLHFIEGGVLLCDDCDLDSIATNVGYNKVYMGRCFSEEMGLSITKYLQLLRLDKAKELLLTTNYDVNRISKLLNYNDTTHFIRVFKKHFQTTPENFRKNGVKEFPIRYSFRLSGSGDNE